MCVRERKKEGVLERVRECAREREKERERKIEESLSGLEKCSTWSHFFQSVDLEKHSI